MKVLIFPVRTAFVLSWTLTDENGAGIGNANVTATLFAGRSMLRPNVVPGTSVSPLINTQLNVENATVGLYSSNVPGTLEPAPDGVGYTLVIDATIGAAQIYHAEVPVVIETAGASADLTTVAAVKHRAEVTNTEDDDEIQAGITAFSQFLLNYTGQLSLNSIVEISETRDGHGNNRLMTRHWPIVSLVSLKMNGVSMPVSTSANTPGVYVEQSKKSVAIRTAGAAIYPWMQRAQISNRWPCFVPGKGNIEITYQTGYIDVPADLEYAVRCVVALNYKRKGWQDLESRGVTTQGTSATTRYRDWAWPPECDKIFEFYKVLSL